MPIIIKYNPKLRARASELRKANVLSEALLWNQIKNKKLNGLDFDRQRVIGNYIADFCCPDTGTIIEIDGSTHDHKIEYDERREQYLKSIGLEIIHILDRDVKQNMDGVVRMLATHPFLQKPMLERKCQFVAVDDY